jgi:hypothetical protein
VSIPKRSEDPASDIPHHIDGVVGKRLTPTRPDREGLEPGDAKHAVVSNGSPIERELRMPVDRLCDQMSLD